MDFLPINLRINRGKILIVGGGRVATHKALILRRFTENIMVVAPEISETLQSLPFEKKPKAFDSSDLNGISIVYACTGKSLLNQEIKAAATERGILANICDNPSLCDFTSPAIFSSDGITIAVSSDAKDVKRSIRVRNIIQKAIEDGKIQIE